MSKIMDYRQFGNEMMSFLQKLDINETEAGEILVSLLETAEKFRLAQQWQQAKECCEHCLNMTGETWIQGIDISLHYGKGLVCSRLGTIHLSSEKVNVAVEYFEQAAYHFRKATPSRALEEGVVRMILSKIYANRGEWGKALGAAQHSLNAVNDKFLPHREEKDKTYDLVQTIRSEIDEVKQQLTNNLSQKEHLSPSGHREVTYLPIYEEKIGKECLAGNVALDKGYDNDAEYIFLVNKQNAIDPDIKQDDLVFIRPLVFPEKKEFVLVILPDASLDESPTFMQLLPRKNHYCLIAPPTREDEKCARFIIVLDHFTSRETVESLYQSLKMQPSYVKQRDIKILGKAVSILRPLEKSWV